MHIENFEGLLYIGDPHASSQRIGRRKDDYTASCLGKLSEAAKISREQKLYPVILGDLLHRNGDNKMTFLNALVRVLKEFACVPLVLGGNHDKGQTELSDEDALTLLRITGVVDVLDDPADVRFLSLAGHSVRLIGIPYGAAIPASVGDFEGTTFAITHHDLAFGSAYPGSQPLFEMQGCDAVVNGHMHDSKSSVQMGQTWWHNPGNIEPLSVDLMHHIPRVWSWRPGQPTSELKPHVLPHELDVFDLTGLHVQAAGSDESVAEMAPLASEFATLLSSENAMDAGKTDDASILFEDLTAVLEVANVSDAAKSFMQSLCAEVFIEGGFDN